MLNAQQQEIYARYKQPEHGGHLEDATYRLDGANPLCGDEIHLDVLLDPEGRIARITHYCRACAICTAAADLLPELVGGMTLIEITSLDSSIVTDRLGINLSPTRLKCALLPLETLRTGLDS